MSETTAIAKQQVPPTQALQRREPPMTIAEVKEWGDIFFKSGMFTDLNNMAQAMVKIKAGNELDIPPFMAMNGIHIIKGKTSLGATIQASLVQRSNAHRYQVHKLDTDSCVIEFFGRGADGNWKSLGLSEFSMADAEAAKLAGKGGSNEAMYTKYGRNMLFARALTNGMRWYTPELLQSADGQVASFDDFDADKVIADTTDPVQIGVGSAEAPAAPAGEPGDETAIDAEVTEVAQEGPVDEVLQSLREVVMEKVMTVANGEVEEVDKILKGRVIGKMPQDALERFLKELNEASS